MFIVFLYTWAYRFANTLLAAALLVLLFVVPIL